MHLPGGRLAAAVFLLAGLSASKGAGAQGADAAASVPLAVRTHALAFGAILDSANGDPHSRLVPEVSPAERELDAKGVVEMLFSWWGLHDREELLKILDELQSGDVGQRGAFWDYRQRLLSAKFENYFRVISEPSAERDAAAQKFIVATHLASFRNPTLPITAWDFEAIHQPVPLGGGSWMDFGNGGLEQDPPGGAAPPGLLFFLG